jgi:hypothetical protein
MTRDISWRLLLVMLSAACVPPRNPAPILDCTEAPGYAAPLEVRRASSPTLPAGPPVPTGGVVIWAVIADSSARVLNGAVIEFAALSTRATPDSMFSRVGRTNELGVASMSVPAGRAVLRIRHPGVEAGQYSFTVRAGYSDTIDWHLRRLCPGY